MLLPPQEQASSPIEISFAAIELEQAPIAIEAAQHAFVELPSATAFVSLEQDCAPMAIEAAPQARLLIPMAIAAKQAYVSLPAVENVPMEIPFSE